MSLFDQLSQIAQQIQSQHHLIDGEDDTIAVSIHPFFRALGYDPQSLAQVKNQYNADPKKKGTKRVDFALLRNGQPVIFVEAKAANITLTEYNWEQLMAYVNATDVRFGILTNGIEYRFYTDLHKGNIMDQDPFMTIDMLKLDVQFADDLQWFTNSGFDPDRIIAVAKRRLIANLLHKEMTNPSDALVRHFAGQIQSGKLSKDDIPQYKSLITEAWQSATTPPPDSRPSVDPPPGPIGKQEIALYAAHDGKPFEATFIVTENMWLQDQENCRFENELTNHAKAAETAVHSLNPGSEAWHPGWLFWRFTNPLTGNESPLKDLFEDIWKNGPLKQHFFG